MSQYREAAGTLPPPSVSVVVPVYNSEEYLERCLESLVHQTLGGLEIVVVNDGSLDGSQSIIDGYAERYPEKIVPLIKENGGLSDARNFGIAHATGEYLGFVDSDDYVDLDMYERLYNEARSADSDIVCSPITYAWKTKNQKNYFTRVLATFGTSVSESPRVLIWANSFAWNKIYRRSFWIENSLQFPVNQYYEDSAIIYNALYMANRVGCVNIPFYHYVRYREGSITLSHDEKIFDIFKSCSSILTFYRAQPDYSAVKDAVEYVCIKHIFVRFNLLAPSNDRAFVRRYLDTAYAYLDENIPDWRENSFFDRNRMSRLRTIATRFLRSRPRLSKAYYTSPRFLRTAPRTARSALKRSRRQIKNRLKPHAAEQRTEAINERKQLRIQTNGCQLIAATQNLLQREGIEAFADFGTLLGLIREGQLLAHDIDIDLGVIVTDELDVTRTRVAMERFGFRVWREYFRGNETVEASFRLRGIKVDINYYRADVETARTWLFYRDPEKTYGPRERDIVEMTYSPIREMSTILVNGAEIIVPANAEQLLAEKYGPSWRTPDKDWVYWRSPAATPINDDGSFITYSYPGGFMRAGDPGSEGIYERFYNRELATVDASGGEPAELKGLQRLELSILHEVDRICREHHITYYLSEGTLLGAIRHAGFIPWDDDIDIAMPRPDYERFLRVAPHSIGDRFTVQHWTLTPRYWSAFAKVRLLDNSLFYQPPIAHLTPNNGPYIDIFPLDSVPDPASPAQNRQKELMTRFRKALSYKRGDTRPKTSKTKLIRMRTLFHPVESLYGKLNATYRMLEAPGNEYLVNLASYYSAEKETFPVEWYGEPRLVPFEDGLFPVPAEAEAMLARIYGPMYMRLPEIDSRTVKHAMVYRPGETQDL